MEFDGTNWITVGVAGFSLDVAKFISFAINPSGQPCVAYQDFGNLYKATVMRLDGNNWVTIGTAGFSKGQAYGTSLAFSPSGQPYIAFGDGGNLDKATVMYFDAPAGIIEQKSLPISIYPNPATNIVTVESLECLKESSLNIANISGQPLITLQLSQPKTTLDISSLPSGVYFVRLTSEKSVATGKIIKQ